MQDEDKIKLRNILLLDQLQKLDTLLDGYSTGIFKGCALILKGIYRFGEREMSDCDIIVREKDFKEIEDIVVFKLGFRKIEKGRHSYFKEIGDCFAPVIFDIHTYFSVFRFNDFEFEPISGFKNVKSISNVDLMITTSVHSIVNHSQISNRVIRDLSSIYKFSKGIDSNFEDNVMKKSMKYNLSYICYRCFKKIGVNLNIDRISLKELISIPFVNLCFYRHIKLNEYILPFFYEFERVKERIRIRP